MQEYSHGITYSTPRYFVTDLTNDYVDESQIDLNYNVTNSLPNEVYFVCGIVNKSNNYTTCPPTTHSTV